MDYTITPGVWFEVGDTGVSVKYDGTETKTVVVDDQGAVLLPTYSPQDEALLLWSVIPGAVPVFRIDHMPKAGEWPAGYLLHEGHWMKNGD